MAQHTFPALDTNNTFTGTDNFTGNLQINGTTLGTPTGSGAVVLATSPALVGTPTSPTPALGDSSTDIATTNFVQSAILGSRVKVTTQVTNTGNTTNNTIYSVTIPFSTMQVSATSFFRFTLIYQTNVGGITANLSCSLGGQALGNGTNLFVNQNYNGPTIIHLTGLNAGVTNSQIWIMEAGQNDAAGYHFLAPQNTTTINTTANQTLLLKYQNGTNTDSVTFNGFMFEVL